jgi:hypothetical protein
MSHALETLNEAQRGVEAELAIAEREADRHQSPPPGSQLIAHLHITSAEGF